MGDGADAWHMLKPATVDATVIVVAIILLRRNRMK